jgi:hypothetical protein
LADACSTSASSSRSSSTLGFARGGIEDFLLDRRVHRQHLADLRRERLALLAVGLGVGKLLVLLEQFLHVGVIALEQDRRIGLGSARGRCRLLGGTFLGRGHGLPPVFARGTSRRCPPSASIVPLAATLPMAR